MKQRKDSFYCLSILGIIAVLLVIYMYMNTSSFAVSQYMNTMNSREFDKIYALFSESTIPKQSSEEEVTQYMKQYFNENNFVKAVSKGKLNKNQSVKGIDYYEAEYRFGDTTVRGLLSVRKEQGEWKVIFPFKLGNIEVFAPLGSEVYVDDEKVEEYQNGRYICKNKLPNLYTVKISYPNHIYEDYITTIDMPTQSKVISPYRTVSVNIKAPKGMEVTLANQKQISENGITTFYNILEGKYKLRVADEKGYIEPYEQEILISERKNTIEVPSSIPNEKCKTEVQQFVKNFYSEYLEGIKTMDSSFLNQYTCESANNTIKKLFQRWFVDQKNILSANMEVTLENIKVNEEGQLEVGVLEVVELQNKQKNDAGKEEKVMYKVVLRTNNSIDISKDTWKILDRKINESIVAYQDADNNWTEY